MKSNSIQPFAERQQEEPTVDAFAAINLVINVIITAANAPTPLSAAYFFRRIAYAGNAWAISVLSLATNASKKSASFPAPHPDRQDRYTCHSCCRPTMHGRHHGVAIVPQ